MKRTPLYLPLNDLIFKKVFTSAGSTHILKAKGVHSRDFSHELAPVGLETQHVFSV